MYGKTIKQFLIDGLPNGRVSVELSNWIGKALKIPRSYLKESSNRIELQGTGVYLLIGKNPEELSDAVYIGEADGIFKRLSQHLSTDFWNEAIVFVSKDENLNKAHIKYLEHRLYKIAFEAGRYELKNSNTPTKPSISEADKAEMEEFLQNIKLLVNTLGYKLFDKLFTSKTEQRKNTFEIKKGEKIDAKGIPTNEGFVILKGSRITNKLGTSITNSLINLRKQLIQQNIINPETLVFQEDYLFSSPSTAATLVTGRSANGLSEWKMRNGKSLKQFEEE